MRHEPELFFSDEYKLNDLMAMLTSGTSGKPMTICLSKESMGLWYNLNDERIIKQNGIESHIDSFGTFTGQLICHKDQNGPPYWAITITTGKFTFHHITLHRIQVPII